VSLRRSLRGPAQTRRRFILEQESKFRAAGRKKEQSAGPVYAEILREAILITGVVLAMMVVIEFVNVGLGGVGRLQRHWSGWRQYVVAAGLGVLPGCFGPWAVVALYAHGLVSLGALIAAMVATSGDEAYLMMALMPAKAAVLFTALFAAGVATGALTDRVLRDHPLKGVECPGLAYHPEDARTMFAPGFLRRQWKAPTRLRLGLIAAFLAMGVGMAVDWSRHGDWNWAGAVSLAAVGFAAVVLAVVPDHFLEDHLWSHVLRRHARPILLWTLGALAAAAWIVERLPEDFSGAGSWSLLAAACLVGLIPESGPHMIFVTLHAKGAIPLSILFANSIVQDGHGMLPLLGESRRAFVVVKLVNLAAGALAGALWLLAESAGG